MIDITSTIPSIQRYESRLSGIALKCGGRGKATEGSAAICHCAAEGGWLGLYDGVDEKITIELTTVGASVVCDLAALQTLQLQWCLSSVGVCRQFLANSRVGANGPENGSAYLVWIQGGAWACFLTSNDCLSTSH